MSIVYESPQVVVHHGDCIDVMRAMPDASVDAVVTDPPYGLANTDPAHVAETITRWVNGERDYLPGGAGFMGKAWDAFVPPVAVWDECLRVLKPGGHVLAFAGTRTVDLMTLGLRLAGFDIRDSIAWMYGSGFPKSQDVAKFIDKHLGVEGTFGAPKSDAHASHIGKPDYSAEGKHAGWERPWMHDAEAIDRSARVYEGGSDEARRWRGWGTALKPAFEPVVVARKPLAGTVAQNVLAHGTGALNIDGCRVGDGTRTNPPARSLGNGVNMSGGKAQAEREATTVAGRFPANVILDESQAAVLDKQSGHSTSPTSTGRGASSKASSMVGTLGAQGTVPAPGDAGGASRFFYTAKASPSERPVANGIAHPTVKPLDLMRWLVRLVTPRGGVVLEPFAGSGTTLEAAVLEGFTAIGIERESDYLPLIEQRLDKPHAVGLDIFGGAA